MRNYFAKIKMHIIAFHFGIIYGFFLCVCLCNDTEDGHRVHNLILYPDKNEWCEARDIEMIITYPGCTPKAFSNRVCVGQCFSYSSPRTRPPNRVEDKLKYCDFCKPSNSTWERIVLNCDTERYTMYEQEVELIHECECQPCFDDPTVRSKSLEPLDSYTYEYAYEDTIPVADIDLANVVQEQLKSEDVEQFQTGDERYIEFSLNQETLDQVSRLAHHNARERNGGNHNGHHSGNHNGHHNGHQRVVFNGRNPQSRELLLHEQNDDER